MNKIIPSVSLSLFLLFNIHPIFAQSDYLEAQKTILNQRNQLFNELKTHVIPPYPEPHSQAALWDKEASQHVTLLTKKRKKSAEKINKAHQNISLIFTGNIYLIKKVLIIMILKKSRLITV